MHLSDDQFFRPNALFRKREKPVRVIHYTNLDPEDVPFAERWMDHYCGNVNHEMISDHLEDDGRPRHFRLRGVRFTPSGDFLRVAPADNGPVIEIAVELVSEDNLFLRPRR